MDEITTLLFENYLAKELSAEELLAFEKRIQEDPEFASNFKTYQELSKQLAHHFSDERSEFKATLSTVSDAFFEETSPEKKEPKVIAFKPWQYGVAAAIALLVGFFIFQNTGAVSVEDYTFSNRISLTERSGDAPVQEAETNFNTREYSEAIQNFAFLLQEDPSNTEYQFYKALAHDELLQYDEADILFENLMEGTSAYKYKATFYAAISYWKRENIAQTKVLLKRIPKNAGEYKKAQKLLRRL